MAAWRRSGRNLMQALLFGIAALTAAFSSTPATAAVPPYSSIVVEAASGKVLLAEQPDALRHPASLAKLMTLYLTFEALRDHRISLDQLVPVSAHAASMPPTKLGLRPGMRITVQQAILGLVTRSANDAASALGELLGGTEEHFAQMMTLRAHALGMSRTHFANASGLPAPDEWTTARDMALLARRLISDFPNDYHYFSTPSFMFHRQVVLNHDTMLKIYPGVDGMKTGFTDASGHNLVTSAVNDGVRLIGVEFGAPSNGVRDVRMTAMLNEAYNQLHVAVAGETMVARAAPHMPSLIRSAHAAPPPRRAAEAHVRRVVALRDEHGHWGVQVGSFHNLRSARISASRGHRLIEAGEMRTVHVVWHGRSIWRAQIVGLSAAAARDACRQRARAHRPCMVIRPEPREIARD